MAWQTVNESAAAARRTAENQAANPGIPAIVAHSFHPIA